MAASPLNCALAFKCAAIAWERSNARSCRDVSACERAALGQVGNERRGEHSPTSVHSVRSLLCLATPGSCESLR